MTKKSQDKTLIASDSIFQINQVDLRLLFEHSSDVHFHPLKLNNTEILLLYCAGMIEQNFLNEQIIPALDHFLQKNEVSSLKQESYLDTLHLSEVRYITSKDELITAIYTGYGLFHFKNDHSILSIKMENKPQRTPEETSMEVTIKGPRDNFIEDITVNMALIRKRLPTNSLRSEQFTVGVRSKTAVQVVYIDDVVDKEILGKVKKQIEKIEIDAIYSGFQFMQLVENKLTLFPLHDYTGRPDFVVRSLITGRIIILIDGIPYAIITPANFFLLLKSAEDLENPPLASSFGRLIRILGIFLAAFAPGFWVAITAFHPNQLPLTLLATVIQSRTGIPLSAAMEAMIMLLLFDLFREAGLRLPISIGQTLSVVGGLIIGDAAIRAGLTSPSMLVVIAASSVATFTLVNQSLIGIVSLIRFFVLLLSSFFGFLGFFVSGFAIILFLANIRAFGVPYLQLATRFNFLNAIKTILQLPATINKKRSNMFDSKDPTRRK